MSEIEYRQWWPLHRRASLGESLTEAERATYEEGLMRLHASERLPSNQDWRQAEEQMAALEAEHTALIKVRDDLLRRIMELEARQAKRLTPANDGGVVTES